MPVLDSIPIQVEATEVLARQGQGQKQIRSGLLRDAEEMIGLAQMLWQPRAVYEWFDVQAVTRERLKLSSSDGAAAELHIGPKAHLLSGASLVLVAVGTIGPDLERRVHDMQAAGKMLRSYLLDSAGVVALGSVGEVLRTLAEEAAARRNWGVSAALSPGSLVGWPLQGQRELCALLSLKAIGVRLSDYAVLQPHKSFSTIIGIGPDYDSAKSGSICKYCSLADTCWRRRVQPQHLSREEGANRNASTPGSGSA